ncbi:Similar to Kinesin-like protein bimC; acc. no. P17120 [Pyronema omphalodes CBS 100304]|uniref:Similar to Kinesin-like protein bimC acc. no. P17120 n=1 Tax=Pyronema omphalodes (strain CBS 100304) TaxID=1076935 RepID=U4LL00_PYROM|nr:Similar to Kinesin-like protein bimC; acc. no. P17120 [Pyronema omphalodes CBS 100304]
MNGSSRHPSNPLRKQAAAGSMRPPAARGPPRLQPTHPSLLSSPAPSLSARSRAGTVSPTNSRRGGGTKYPESPTKTYNEANINVVVRCRGRSEREKSENSAVVVSHPSTTEVALSLGPNASVENKLYTFDRTFGPEADQQRIYDSVVAPLLNEVLEGYNCTVFAYGQTGTGKTYTMTGDMSDQFGSYSDFAGIIPRVLYKLFEKLRGVEHGDKSVKISFIELYNEELRDLLCAENEPTSKNVKIFDAANGKGGVVVQGMEETYIQSATQGIELLKSGSHKRQVAATKCNELSSRSHTVFTITTSIKDQADDGEIFIRTAKLNLVDLAGSESIGRSGAADKRAREAGMINQSLLTLGRVINALVDKSSHIPYRESKLTRLLQDSLGGRTKTTIIATISPARINLEETMSTLDYASRAKDIQNKPQVNQMLNKKTVIAEFVADIERLKSALHASRLKNGIYLSQEEYNRLNESLELQKNEVEETKREEELLHSQISRLRENFENTMRDLLDTRTTLEDQILHLEQTRSVLKSTELDLSKTTKQLEEETILRKAHQKTEQELSIAGRDLISTARSTTTEIEGLRAKIGRMANTEVENHTIWMKNSTQVKQVTEFVEQATGEFTEEQEELAAKITERISGFVETESTEIQNAYDFIEERLEKFESARQEGDSSLEIGRDEMNNVLEEIKVLREDIKTRIGEGLKGLNNAAERMSNDVITDLGKFGVELRKYFDKFDEEFKQVVEDSQKHMKEQKAEIERLGKELTSATATASEATEKAQESLKTILVEERENSAKDRQNLIAQITTLINSNADEQDERLSKRVDGLQAEITATKTALDEASKTHQNGLDTWSEREESFYTSLCTAQETVRRILSEDWQAIEAHNSTIQTTTRSIHAQTISLVSDQNSNIATQMASLDSFVTRARSSNDSLHASNLEILSSLYSNGLETVSSFSSLIGRFKAELAAIEELSTLATEGVEGYATFREETKNRLRELREKIEGEPLKECLPTGVTPRKRKYAFPTMLPSTGSHEAVLAEALGQVQDRAPLGEKEVNSPRKSVQNADLTEEIAGMGKAFYPQHNQQGKKKTSQGGERGESNDGIVGSGAENQKVMGANLQGFGFGEKEMVGSRRTSLRKRKAEEGENQQQQLPGITTRRRIR